MLNDLRDSELDQQPAQINCEVRKRISGHWRQAGSGCVYHYRMGVDSGLATHVDAVCR